MVETLVTEFWKVTAKLRSMIARLPYVVYKGNEALHKGLRKLLGEGITSLILTALIIQFVVVIFISFQFHISLTDLLTAARVDIKIAHETKQRGWW